jgi:hypothetical protein
LSFEDEHEDDDEDEESISIVLVPDFILITPNWADEWNQRPSIN